MSAAALLDVNVLVALLDPNHPGHDAAHAWFAVSEASGWASCALTEAGLIRVFSNPSYPGGGVRPSVASELLRILQSRASHESWPVNVSLTDERTFDLGRIAGHRQLTDVLLLGLAVTRRARLATFDRAIPWRACRKAGVSSLIVIPA
jgi:toxin-antitoxin system PIN domain toxin